MAIILATWEAEIGRIMVPGQLDKKKKSVRQPSQGKKAGCGGTHLSSQ
jgi:hypothetical protein